VNNTKRTLTAAAVCLVVVALAAGCATLFQQGSQQPLEDRVKGYMQAQVDGKWDKAYDFLDAASRAKTSQESYIHQTRKATYTGFEVEEITETPAGDQARVKLRLDISFMGFDLKRAPHTLTWVKEKGAWFVSSQPQQGNPFTPEEKKK
jgi:hypothetical protein